MWETLKKEIKKSWNKKHKKEKHKSFLEKRFDTLIFLLNITVAKIGYCIHGSIVWSIMDYLFPVFTIVKWFVYEEINMQIIKNCFNFFVN